MQSTWGVSCTDCKRTAVWGEIFCATCGGELVVTHQRDRCGEHVPAREHLPDTPSIWRYRDLLPVSQDDTILTFMEGMTPLIPSHHLAKDLGLDRLFFKRDDQNPTGSFKDRQVAVSATVARSLGKNVFVAISSGNAAASTAAYGVRAGVHTVVYVPDDTPPPKIAQIAMYGAELRKVEGMYGHPKAYYDLMVRVRAMCVENGWWPLTASRKFNPYAVEGSKTVAFEICEQLGWTAPDVVVVPVGGGALCGALWKGFKELHDLKWINRLPRVIGAEQAHRGVPIEESAEVLEALRSGRTAGLQLDRYQFVPLDGPWAWTAIRESKGAKIGVSATEMEECVALLARREGIFAEILSARAVAGLRKAVKDGLIEAGETVVCLVTGSGLKDVV